MSSQVELVHFMGNISYHFVEYMFISTYMAHHIVYMCFTDPADRIAIPRNTRAIPGVEYISGQDGKMGGKASEGGSWDLRELSG